MRKKTTEEFIKDAIKIHGNKYDYSLVKYNTNNIKIIIKCNRCDNIFEQIPNSHLKGSGCQKCSGVYSSSTEEIIKKFIKIHGDKYDYSLVEYKNNRTKVKIICKIHNEIFEQRLDQHRRGQGCPKCAGNIKLITKEFIGKAIKIHGDKYDYSLVEYELTNIKVRIICKIHGIFKQLPNRHLNGDGCPLCNSSKGEIKIKNLFDSLGITYEIQKKFKECKHKRLLSFDFFIPEQNLIVEYDGKQHYEPIDYFGGDEQFKIIQLRDKIKENYCFNNNIDLLRIPYIEFNNIENIIIDRIKWK